MSRGLKILFLIGMVVGALLAISAVMRRSAKQSNETPPNLLVDPEIDSLSEMLQAQIEQKEKTLVLLRRGKSVMQELKQELSNVHKPESIESLAESAAEPAIEPDTVAAS